MGGRGSSSSLNTRAIKNEGLELTRKLNNGEIDQWEYYEKKSDLMAKYGIDASTFNSIVYSLGDSGSGSGQKSKQTSEKPAQAKKQSQPQEQGTDYSSASNLAGQNGNPWPPEARGHLSYEGRGAQGIVNQFNGAVSYQTAQDMAYAVNDYSMMGYADIRWAYAKGDTTSEYGREAVTIQNFIDTGISTGNGWSGGATYRGISGMNDAAWNNLKSLKRGDSVDCNLSAPASWTTSVSTAESFRIDYHHVTFVHLGNTQKGVSISNLSSRSSEKEVLVSGKAKYKVAAVTGGQSDKDHLYVYVEDAD